MKVRNARYRHGTKEWHKKRKEKEALVEIHECLHAIQVVEPHATGKSYQASGWRRRCVACGKASRWSVRHIALMERV